MAKRKIRIAYSDFWPLFDEKDNIFHNTLKEDYEVIIDQKNPEILFFSVFGNRFERYNCKRVFFTGENFKPLLDKCDYSFSFDPDTYGGKNYRLPHYIQMGDPKMLTMQKDPKSILLSKTKFCNFVYSNPDCKKRNEFFKKLSKYKKVDSPGRYMNNIGKNIGIYPDDKINFIRPYKFAITFENEEAEYYTTEKIFEAMKVNSLPIYWGNPKIGEDFNTDSFLNYYDYGSDEALIEKIIELDKDDAKYMDIMSRPWYSNNKIPDCVKIENIRARFREIVESDIEPVSSRSPYFSGSELRSRLYITNSDINYKIKMYKGKFQKLSPARIKLKLHRMIHER
ncbi:MAG: glycosyltransferase family 10 domain-containing protein [Bacteroidota bacterium]